MANAKLVCPSKMIYPDGAIREMVIWQLPRKSAEMPHALKYRLCYCDSKGNCLVRYDNETGKWDHRHIKGKEESYNFTSVEQLVKDFQNDIDSFRKNL